MGAIALVGRGFLHTLGTAGDITLFALKALSHLVRPPFYGRLFVRAFVKE